ncbi:MAG: hypothetical protein IAG10_28205, partial [Planctomycetaceae bacterium]|nr:hypothetical protein [Planctomycetaceae bacterium]
MLPDALQAHARTVAHLAVYFEELKQAALRLRDQFSVRERGFFSPSEDEAARQLLISYWMARTALFEVVLSYRDAEDFSASLKPTRFLIVYSAALLLVDAARFLRENYHDQPAIRAKLNEPEPHFGIPSESYDTVQRSLTSPVHVWHLYHAVRYHEEQASELHVLAADPLLAPLIEVVDRLGPRLQVSVYEFAKARIRVRTRQLSNAVCRGLIDRALYGLQKVACLMVTERFTRLGHQPSLPAAVAEELRSLLRPGDVIVNRKEFALTNYFLPGYWPHAAFYLGQPGDLERLGLREHHKLKPRWQRLLELDPHDPGRVLEAMRDGVWLRSLGNPFRADAIAVVRPMLSSEDIAQAIGRGMLHEGKAYDFDFDFTRSDRLVCTEVVYRSYQGIGGIQFPLTRRAG